MRKHFLTLFGIAAVVLSIGALFGIIEHAASATNVSSAANDHWAWNDGVGWIDFYSTNTVTVDRFALTGYASSSAGDISLDCHTTRIGDICGTSSYQVTNDGLGNLSGWGWNDEIGWISFDCHNTNGCGTSSYEVSINSDTGIFQSYAWNDAVGWISFNCADTGGCATSNYRVVTSWIAVAATGTVDSATFDTGSAAGAQVNSILWHGSQPAGTSVGFQVAVSNSASGPWSYQGPSGTSGDSYTSASGPDVPISISYTLSEGRYFRYRILLTSNKARTVSPRVDDVSVNWSP